MTNNNSQRLSIYLYIPNIMDYIRVVLLIVALWYMKINFVYTAVCYTLASFLDSLDGFAARSLQQKSNFGAVLDTIIDRTSIAAFKIGLAQLYPEYTFYLQLDVIIDLGGHWMYTWMALLKGSKSHKNSTLTKNPILKLYYSSRPFLFTMVAGSELFWVLLYTVHFHQGPLVNVGPQCVMGMGIWTLLLYICLPFAVGKVLITLMHIKTASRNIVEVDDSSRGSKYSRTIKTTKQSGYYLRSSCVDHEHAN